MTLLYTNKAIRDLEERLYAQGEYESWQLMQRAGKAAWGTLRHSWEHAKRIAVFCGRGNNGGDGYYLACLAHQAGLEVQVYSVGSPDELSGSAAKAAQAALEVGVSIQPIETCPAIDADLIVDALLGSGLNGSVRAPYTEIIRAINASDVPVLAIDIPSGLDADTGQILGVAVQAEVTVTFIALKQGLYTHKASACVGSILCHDLDIAQKELQTMEPTAELLDWPAVTAFLPKRRRYSHKGDYGHVLVIGGDYGMAGAVRLAAEAALRVGAGLVSVATRPEHVAIVTGSRPEVMCHPVSKAEELEPLLSRATVIVIGPGLGQSDWARELLSKVLSCEHPKVIDADGLNLLANSEEVTQDESWILTPHPGEAARLLACSTQEIQDNRYQAALNLQRRFKGVVVLKGVGSIIQNEHCCAKICAAGNPGMASGGMGDSLSGIIGGLVAQKLMTGQATEAGVLIHAFAADRAAHEGGERGLIASDLLPHIRQLVNPHRFDATKSSY